MDKDTKLRFEGKFDEYKGRIKEAYGDLTDDDLQKTEGKWDQLVGTIKQKTGHAVDEIEDKLHKIFN